MNRVTPICSGRYREVGGPPPRPPWGRRRLGLPGYTVAWTLVFWFAGDPAGLVPAAIVSWPIAEGVQFAVDWVRLRIFS